MRIFIVLTLFLLSCFDACYAKSILETLIEDKTIQAEIQASHTDCDDEKTSGCSGTQHDNCDHSTCHQCHTCHPLLVDLQQILNLNKKITISISTYSFYQPEPFYRAHRRPPKASV